MIPQKKLRRINAHDGGVTLVIALPHTNILVSGGGDSKIKVWEKKDSTYRMRDVIERRRFPVASLHHRKRDATVFASCSGDKRALIFDTERAQAICQFVHKANVRQVLFPNAEERQNEVVTLSESNTLLHWDMRSSFSSIMTFDPSVAPVNYLQFVNPQSQFATVSKDDVFRLFDLDNTNKGKPIFEYRNDNLPQLNTIEMAPSGFILNSVNGESKYITNMNDQKTKVNYLYFVANLGLRFLESCKFVVGVNETEIITFRPAEHQPFSLDQHRKLSVPKGSLPKISFSPDSKYVTLGNKDGCLNIWDFKSGSICSILHHSDVEKLSCFGALWWKDKTSRDNFIVTYGKHHAFTVWK